MRKLISTLTAIVMAVFIVDAASAADRNWIGPGGGSGKNGNWNADANWSEGVQPTSSDRAIFPSNSATQYIVTVNSSEACQSMSVHGDCLLDVVTSGTLAVGSADGQTSNIAGIVRLPNSTSIVRFDYDHTIAPLNSVYGFVRGVDNSARVQLADNAQLTNQIYIEGALQLEPVTDDADDGTAFLNDTSGVVRANLNNGTLILEASDLVAGAGAFQVSASGAILRFNVGDLSLTGQFTASAGTLDFQASVTTSGQLSFTGGTIQVAASVSFSAS